MRAALLASLTACSYLGVTPPADPPQPAGDCTTSFLWPRLDLLGMIAGGALTLLGGLLLFSGSSGKQDSGAAEGAGLVIGVPSLAATIVFAKSTSYGHNAVDTCEKRHRRED